MGTPRRRVDLLLCFREAWRGFSLWWIPLCAVSAVWLATEWLHRSHVRMSFAKAFSPFEDAWRALPASPSPMEMARFMETCRDLLMDPAVAEPILAAMMTVVKITGLFTVIACVLNIAIVAIAKAAVRPKKESIDVRRYAKRSPLLTASYFLLAFIKVLAFFAFILPGVLLYVKLYFTSFIILEESANPWAAMRRSWAMTRGIFMPVLALFIANIVIDIVAAATIIGFIPANSFNYTLRAAAYRQVCEAERNTVARR